MWRKRSVLRRTFDPSRKSESRLAKDYGRLLLLSANVADCIVAAASAGPFRGSQIAANYRTGPHGTLAVRPRCLLRARGRIMGQLWRSVLLAP
jgi:hypothetical protein